MALVKMKKILNCVMAEKRACPSFSIYNMETLIGVIRAAEELNSPIIVQLAELRFKIAPLELVGPMMIEAAEQASIDVAVHLDHGINIETIKRALDMGFTSVMYDGSMHSYEENIKQTKAVVSLAHNYNATVEAELGLVGRSEGGGEDCGIQYTDPDDAVNFSNETHVDALAIAIGNQHGNYTREINLQYNILQEIHNAIPNQPLVLHGGSGLSDDQFKRCITCGISKINIATSLLNQMVINTKEYLSMEGSTSFYEISKRMSDGAYNVAKHHINVFNMK